MFFRLSTLVLTLVLFAVIVGATAVGLLIGRSLRHKAESLREPFGVMQAALLGFMGLVLAFGLSLAVGRYEGRRAAVVEEANALGTTYLRAQTVAEPARTGSLALLRRFADTSIRISRTVPGSREEQQAIADSGRIERQLWGLAGQALRSEPNGSAARLYVESLNEMFDAQSSRVYGLSNRVPTPVLLLEVVGSAAALGLLALHLTTLGRGVLTVAMAAVLVTLILVVTFDLDRPTRGLIRIPDAPLIDVRASMLPPAASAGSGPTAQPQPVPRSRHGDEQLAPGELGAFAVRVVGLVAPLARDGQVLVGDEDTGELQALRTLARAPG